MDGRADSAGRSWEKGSWVKAFGVTPEEMARLTACVAEVLDDRVLSREELVAEVSNRLQRPDLATQLRSGWGAVLKPVAWQGVLCHGPAPGNRVTFARPDRLLAGWTGLPEPTEAARIVVPRYLRACRAAGWIAPVVVAGGRVVGTWDRDGASVDVQLFDDDTAVSKRSLDAAMARMRSVLEALNAD